MVFDTSHHPPKKTSVDRRCPSGSYLVFNHTLVDHGVDPDQSVLIYGDEVAKLCFWTSTHPTYLGCVLVLFLSNLIDRFIYLRRQLGEGGRGMGDLLRSADRLMPSAFPSAPVALLKALAGFN